MNVCYPKARKLGFTIMAFLAVTLGGCCSHPASVIALNRGIAATKGDLNDDTLDEKAKAIALTSYDVFWQVKFDLTGTPLPEDVAKRAADRAAVLTQKDGGQ